MNIICATNMPFAREAFQNLGKVEILKPEQINAAAVKGADLLAVRSTTRVNRELLEGSRVKFVGTATIGFDHIDTDYLDQAGIRWCSAAGCNANSVAEYVVAALLRLAARYDFTLAGRTVALIGVGHIGRLVLEKFKTLGLRVLQNDPPRREAEGSEEFLELDEILPQADIVTLHTPLTADGPYPTRHLADAKFFARLKPGAIFINAARGAVLDSNALLEAKRNGIVVRAVLDAWEGEPVYRTDVMDAVDFATPHIAGHSFEGKVMGTVIVFREACRFLGVDSDWSHKPLMPATPTPEITLQNNAPEERLLDQAVRKLYDIETDDRALRATAELQELERGKAFEELRRCYPVRREFHNTRIIGPDLPASLKTKLTGLGFIADA